MLLHGFSLLELAAGLILGPFNAGYPHNPHAQPCKHDCNSWLAQQNAAEWL